MPKGFGYGPDAGKKKKGGPQMGHSPAEMSPYKMGHSPAEMGHSPMENQNKGYAKQERKDLLNINPIANHASGSWMSKHSNSAFQMGHSPMEMGRNGEDKDPKNKKKNTSGVFGGDTIMGDENKDGNMLSRGLKRLDRALSDPTQKSATRPIVKDGKLNFDLGRMGSVGTGLDK